MAPDEAVAGPLVVINARAAIRTQIGGVERFAREMALRLTALRPDRYRVVHPPAALAHRAGHIWEQAVLPLQASRATAIFSPANLAPVISRRNVVVIHDAAALRHPEAYSPRYVAYQRRMLPLIAARARLLITVSEFARGELIDVLDVSADTVVVIPEGVGPRFSPAVDATEARRRYGLTGPYVLALGTVSNRKNLVALEPAARALHERGIELVLGGSDRGYLRATGTGLRRLGYVPEEHLPGLYAGARALAMASLYEGFGLPCLEAMASGIPVVAADAGALPETCGEAALLVSPRDPAGLASALVAAATDQQLRARLTAAGLARASQYPWTRTAALTDAAITDLLERG